jgi:hypothetical protein
MTRLSHVLEEAHTPARPADLRLCPDRLDGRVQALSAEWKSSSPALWRGGGTTGLIGSRRCAFCADRMAVDAVAAHRGRPPIDVRSIGWEQDVSAILMPIVPAPGVDRSRRVFPVPLGRMDRPVVANGSGRRGSLLADRRPAVDRRPRRSSDVPCAHRRTRRADAGDRLGPHARPRAILDQTDGAPHQHRHNPRTGR